MEPEFAYLRVKVSRLASVLILSVLILGVVAPFAGSVSARSSHAVEIIIINNSSKPTPPNFQQEITFNPSAYRTLESPDLGNIRFCLVGTVPCVNGPLDSWLESCGGSFTTCSNTASTATFWVNLGPKTIHAGRTASIYMIFLPKTATFDGIVAGESPELSASYGAYDNGANVFNFYDNFAGNSLNLANWHVVSGMSYSVNNQLVYNQGSCNRVYVTSVPSFAAPYGVDFLGAGTTGNDMGIWFGAQSRGSVSYTNLWAQRGSSSYYDQLYTGDPAPYYFPSFATGTYSFTDTSFSVYSLLVGPNNSPITGQKSYSTVVTATGFPNSYLRGYLGPRDCGGSEIWQWVRVRAYPPGGVMPTANFILLPSPSLPIPSAAATTYMAAQPSGSSIRSL